MTWLAQWAPAIAALACWSVVLLVVLRVYFDLWPLRYLWLAAGCLLWTIFFGLLYSSAGPHPVFARGESVHAIRNAELLGGVCVLVWVALKGRVSITLSWPKAGALLIVLCVLGVL